MPPQATRGLLLFKRFLTSSATGPRTPTNSDSRCFWLWAPARTLPEELLRGMVKVEGRAEVMARISEGLIESATARPPRGAAASRLSVEEEIIGMIDAAGFKFERIVCPGSP